MVVGASGGPRIITATLQTILNHLFVGMDLFDAVSSPRIHDQLLLHGEELCAIDYEVLFGGEIIETLEKTKNALLRRGRDDLENLNYLGSVQGISIDSDGFISGISDIRKGGKPAGIE